jgi:hypothetical protein
LPHSLERKGAVYTISSIQPARNLLNRQRGVVSLNFIGMDPTPYQGYLSHNYRKIDECDDSFKEQMKACKPMSRELVLCPTE